MAEPTAKHASAASPADAASPAVMATYARQNLIFERGEGCWLIAADGQRYLDFGTGVAVNSLGHAHPHLVAALKDQSEKLWHTSNLYRVAGQERVAERLCASTFAETVFFCNSGAEACEGAIKTARRYHFAKGNPERWRIVTFEGAFHGRTLTALSAAGNPKYLEGFGHPADGFDHVPFADLDAVEAAVTNETAAVMIEPVQGEGGVRIMPPGCLEGLRDFCDKHGLLLILDEVQTGVGRTGTFFAHEQAEIAPDIMAVAKGLGGGFPLGAILATREAACGMIPGTHGSTFGGNPLAMAVADAVLDVVLAPGFLEDVARKSGRLRQGLAEIEDEFADLVAEVRIAGLLSGLKLRENVKPADLVAACIDEQLLTVPAGDNVLRILPPLIVTEEEIADGLARLKRGLSSLRRRSD
jgi:acetylornithine/N-succinyldiaminopimelate aminotransferase